MTDRKSTKGHRLAYEILGLIGISGLLAALVYWILSRVAGAIVESYCFNNNIIMTEFDWLDTDRWIFSISAIFSCGFFSVLFLSLLSDRMRYIRTLTEGIHALGMGQTKCTVPVEGKNELSELAQAINDMSAARERLREKEQTLASEKEQLIRTLSHDIRTPLTSVLVYSEYLANGTDIPEQTRKEHLQMIQKKALQIRDLTELLLDGGKRNLEHFEDAHLLIRQLAAEFEEELEEQFTVQTDLSGCPSFAGTFDVQELRRIFDNLSSNAQKYADPAHPVRLYIYKDAEGLHIEQSNTPGRQSSPEHSYRLGINSIRRIAQHYGGQVAVTQDGEIFSISIILTQFL